MLEISNKLVIKYYENLRAYFQNSDQGHDESILRSVEDKIGITNQERLEFRQAVLDEFINKKDFDYNTPNAELIRRSAQEVTINNLYGSVLLPQRI